MAKVKVLYGNSIFLVDLRKVDSDIFFKALKHVGEKINLTDLNYKYIESYIEDFFDYETIMGDLYLLEIFGKTNVINMMQQYIIVHEKFNGDIGECIKDFIENYDKCVDKLIIKDIIE